MINIVKILVARIYNEIKFSDITTRLTVEYVFAIIIIVLFFLHRSNNIGSEPIIFILISWALLAIMGFFIPKITHSFVFSKTKDIPIVLKVSSKGGFIAAQRIDISAKIVNLPNEDSKQKFRNNFEEFDIVYFKSVAYPIQKTKFLEGEPSCGGVSINMKTCKGNATIAYNKPGMDFPTVLYKNKSDGTFGKTIFEGDSEMALMVSPAENYIQCRFFSITYGLTLLILLVTLISLKVL